MKDQTQLTQDLLQFLNDSPVNFLAVDQLRRRAEAAGFTLIDAAEPLPALQPGMRLMVMKNHSSIYLVRIGRRPMAETGFRLVCAHSDSPCFRLKPSPEILDREGTLRLNTEVYGGPILYTWFDRPLSLAGRVILRSDDVLNPTAVTVCFKRPMLTIPHLAIHFNRAVNEGNKLSKQKDMLPVVGRLPVDEEAEGWLKRTVARELGVDPYDILDYDLSIYDTTKATVMGAFGDFIQS